MNRNYLFGTAFDGATFGQLGFSLLRIFSGMLMFYLHGLGKLPPSQQFVEMVAALGFPSPLAFAWAAGLAECVGGLFLMLGFLTRPAAFFILINMLVAVFGQHGSDPLAKKELALIYGSIALAFVFAGGGKVSLDAMLSRKK